MESLYYVLFWVFGAMIVGLGIGFYLGATARASRDRELARKDRVSTLHAISGMLATTQQLNQDVGAHSDEIRAAGKHIVELETDGDLREIQHALLGQVASVLESNQQLEDDLKYAQLRMEEQAQEIDRTRKEARTDVLSGVANRKAFEEKLELYLALWRREQVPFALVVFDIDHCKWINDTHGHQSGDLVVSNVGKFLREHIRKSDFVGRYGGDEFVILFSDIELDEASDITERLRTKVTRTNFGIGSRNEEAAVTFSIGVAAPWVGATAQEIFEHADKALYRSKEAGRNKVFCYRSEEEVVAVTATKTA